MVLDFNAFNHNGAFQLPRSERRDIAQHVSQGTCDDYQEDQIRFMNPHNTQWMTCQSRSSAYMAKKRAQSSAVERSESPYAPINPGHAGDGQSSVRSQSSERIFASGPGPRMPVQTIVAACESNIQKARRNHNVTHAIFANETERFDIRGPDDQAYEDDDVSNWCRPYTGRDKGKHRSGKGEGDNKGEGEGGSYNAGVFEWPQRTHTARDYCNRGDEMSVVDSVAESEGSRSLGAIKWDREVIVAKQELERKRIRDMW
jgi:hypothetical protein